VGAFAAQKKSANMLGRSVRGELEKLDRDVGRRVDEMANDPTKEPFQELFRSTVSEGQHHERTCQQVVHDELPFSAVAWPDVRAWVRNANGMSGFFRLTPQQQASIMRSS
jgi:hypothetical protein